MPNEEKSAIAPKKSRRGFASMSPEKRREIARLGGIAAHAQGTGHEFTKEEAAAAGRKGGLSAKRKKQEKKDADS